MSCSVGGSITHDVLEAWNKQEIRELFLRNSALVSDHPRAPVGSGIEMETSQTTRCMMTASKHRLHRDGLPPWVT